MIQKESGRRRRGKTKCKTYKFGGDVSPERRGHNEARDRNTVRHLLQGSSCTGKRRTGDVHSTVPGEKKGQRQSENQGWFGRPMKNRHHNLHVNDQAKGDVAGNQEALGDEECFWKHSGHFHLCHDRHERRGRAKPSYELTSDPGLEYRGSRNRGRIPYRRDSAPQRARRQTRGVPRK